LLEIAGKENTKTLYCKTLQSAYIENRGGGKFRKSPLPLSSQTAPIYGVLTDDVNQDGNMDFLAIGNSYAPDVVSGRCDAFIGQVMMGDGRGNFKEMPVTQSGFFVDGDAKSIVRLAAEKRMLTIAAQNDDSLRIFERRNTRIGGVVKPGANEVAATLTYKNGSINRREISYGTTYLSESSRTIFLPPEVIKVQLVDANGKTTRVLSFKQ
jgi:hypothetical protein